MFEYIAQGNLNIRIHRDITGEMWFEIREKDRIPALTFISCQFFLTEQELARTLVSP